MRAPDAERLIPAAREIVRSLDPDLVPAFKTVAQLESASVAPRRFNFVMVGVFGATALLLALAGIYGAVAFNVAQRTREIGVRVALGAQTRAVVAMVLRKSLAWVLRGRRRWGVRGSRGGAPRRFAAVRNLAARSTRVCGGGCDAVARGTGRGVVPALRAARVDPMVALRSE
jgi:putative ABC transport system permease protein